MTNEAKPALLIRVEILEQEIAAIKEKLARKNQAPKVKLEGLWKDMDVTDEDIEQAKRSLFREIDDI